MSLNLFKQGFFLSKCSQYENKMKFRKSVTLFCSWKIIGSDIYSWIIRYYPGVLLLVKVRLYNENKYVIKVLIFYFFLIFSVKFSCYWKDHGWSSLLWILLFIIYFALFVMVYCSLWKVNYNTRLRKISHQRKEKICKHQNYYVNNFAKYILK